jgi:DNA-directed RNA polymerase sigma subunit (sigma70/sigma32)
MLTYETDQEIGLTRRYLGEAGRYQPLDTIACSDCSEKQRQAFVSRYGLDDSLELITLAEVAKQAGCSRQNIHLMIASVWHKVQMQGSEENDPRLRDSLWRIRQLEGMFGELVKFRCPSQPRRRRSA